MPKGQSPRKGRIDGKYPDTVKLYNLQRAFETLIYWLVQTPEGILRLDEADKLMTILNGDD